MQLSSASQRKAEITWWSSVFRNDSNKQKLISHSYEELITFGESLLPLSSEYVWDFKYTDYPSAIWKCKVYIQFFPDAEFSHVRSLVFQAHQNSHKNNVTSHHVKNVTHFGILFYFGANISNLICDNFILLLVFNMYYCQ